MDLANSLGGKATKEQTDAPCHLAPSITGPSQLPHDNGHQCCPTHTGGAQPGTTVKPMAAIWAEPQPRRMPDLVDQADNWVWVQMSWEGKHPHWLKELRALSWDCLVGDLHDVYTYSFPMAGCSLQATPCSSRSFWMVRGSSQPEHTTSVELPTPS